jgi:hypothetical protein
LMAVGNKFLKDMQEFPAAAQPAKRGGFRPAPLVRDVT